MGREHMQSAPRAARVFVALGDVPRGVWVLGFVSMLMDISSEIIHSLLPVYLVTVMGTSTLVVGLIEGVSEASVALIKVVSGVVSDKTGQRRQLVALGYGLAALSKPAFPLAQSLGWLVAARITDRVGKGIRGAPRDALIADLSPVAVRGASFGLRQSLDTTGAVLGPIVALLAMWVTANNFKLVFWLAVVPGLLSFALAAFAVPEPERAQTNPPPFVPFKMAVLTSLGQRFWQAIFIAALFTLARFSEAFLILRAQSAGLATGYIPLVLIVMNLAYAAAAYPAGALSDATDRRTLLSWSLLPLIGADMLLASTGGLGTIFIGVALWGLHLALSQGVLSALVADTAPTDLRGTAFGVFSFVTGLALLAASLIAGAIWDAAGPNATFATGAVLAIFALAAVHLAGPTLEETS
jgi:MFS family permease